MATQWEIIVSDTDMNYIMNQFISNSNGYWAENPIIISDDDESDLRGEYNDIYFITITTR